LLPLELERKATELQNLEKQQHKTMTEQDTQITALTKENVSLTKETQGLQEETNVLTKSKKELENKLLDMKGEKQRLHEENKVLSQIRTTARKEYEDAGNQFTVLHSGLGEEQDFVSDLTGETEVLKEERKKLTKEVDDIDDQIARLEREVAAKKQTQELELSTNNKTKENSAILNPNGSRSPSPNDKTLSPLIDEKAEAKTGEGSNCQCCMVL